MATSKAKTEEVKEEVQEEVQAEVKEEVKKPEKVQIFVDKGYVGDEPNHFIGINGVNYILPKGKYSMVPPHVAEEYVRSRKAETQRDENIEEMLKEASK